MENKNKRFSFAEMEFIAVEFAKSCIRGYEGSFEDYFSTEIRKDWRPLLKKVRAMEQKTNIEDYHRMVTTPYYLCKDLKISKVNSSDCNCGQPSCTFGCS